ncbi:MAG: sulfate reduction electron transfer complex DsrMKJOP subunit DsrO [Nitrospirota bacterium]
MSINRRQFLKIAGISTVFGLGGASVFNAISRGSLEAAQVLTDPQALKAKRWGMVIDMSKFETEEDIKRVKDICHKIHNVPDFGDDKMHEIKWIWPETFEHAFPGEHDEYFPEELKEQPFMVLCNHCAQPACVRVCPTKATFKRADGIVMMDMHRCIGCRFCMAACPFGARSFNWKDPRPYIKEEDLTFPTRTKGVVEKCTFCYERLAIGKAPACVEESKGGIIYGDLEDPKSEIREILRTKYTIRRKPGLGTQPSIYYVIDGKEKIGGKENV